MNERMNESGTQRSFPGWSGLRRSEESFWLLGLPRQAQPSLVQAPMNPDEMQDYVSWRSGGGDSLGSLTPSGPHLLPALAQVCEGGQGCALKICMNKNDS